MQRHAAVPNDVLGIILRQPRAWHDFDIDRDLDHRRRLRSAALVHRSWTAVARSLLGETIIIRRLADFDAVSGAGETGALRVDSVRILVLDDGVSREVDGDEAAWRAFEAENGGPVDRTAQEVINAWGGHRHEPIAETMGDFSRRALNLVERLTRLESVRSSGSDVFTRTLSPWPIVRLAVAHLSDGAEWVDAHGRLMEALDRWDRLGALSIGRFDDIDEGDAGLGAVPVGFGDRLRELHLGRADDLRSGGGASVRDEIFAGSASSLRILEIRWSDEPRFIGSQDGSDDGNAVRSWPALVFGPALNRHDRFPVLERLVVGCSHRLIDSSVVAELLEMLPPSLQHFDLVVGISSDEADTDGSSSEEVRAAIIDDFASRRRHGTAMAFVLDVTVIVDTGA